MAALAIIVTVVIFLSRKREEPPGPTPAEGSFIKLTIIHKDTNKPVGSGSTWVRFFDVAGDLVYEWPVSWNEAFNNSWTWTSPWRIKEPGIAVYELDNYGVEHDGVKDTIHIVYVGVEDPQPLPTRTVSGFVKGDQPGSTGITDASVLVKWTDIHGSHEISTKTFQGDYEIFNVTDGVDFDMVVGAYQYASENRYVIAGTSNPINFNLTLLSEDNNYIALTVYTKLKPEYLVYVEWFDQILGRIVSFNIVVNSPPVGNEFFTWLDNKLGMGAITDVQHSTAKQLYLDAGGG